jgi:hypothetical protein
MEQRLTFTALCELEPRLRALYAEAQAVQDDPETPAFCANRIWYGRIGRPGLKRRLGKLVGWNAGYEETPNALGVSENAEPTLLSVADLRALELECGPRRPMPPQLTTSAAYALATDTIYGVLPPCRNCTCC